MCSSSLIVQRGGMVQRDVEYHQAQRQAFEEYVRATAGVPSGTADELAKLADLRDRGLLTDAEFQRQKAKLLA